MRLAFRMLARDWRAGELGVLAAALVIAVASVTSVGFFADRVGRALARDAGILGADLVLVSDHPFDPAFAGALRAEGLDQASAVAFVSMARSGELAQLAGVKAVTPNYPLRGRLRIAAAPGAADSPAPPGPPRGKVWMEERLVSALGAPVGGRIKLGHVELIVDAVLTLEPERTASFFNVAPRLFMNAEDVEATGLIQTGSRVSYYLYAAGAQERIAAAEKRLKPLLGRGQRLETLETGRPEIRAGIERAQRFLGLTALLAAVLAGVAIALASRRFVERHLDGCAVMRCFGATQGRLVAVHALEFLFLGLAACTCGALAGFAAQAGIGAALGDLVRAELPPPGPLPAVQGFLVGLVLLLGFAVPPLLRLKNVPALRVLRRESSPQPAAVATYVAGFVALAALLVWQAGDVRMGAYVVGGFAAALLAYFALAWAAIRALASRAMARAAPLSLRIGLASLRRHASGNAIQAACLALGLTSLLLLTFTRNDLVDAWRRSAPPDAPNRFLLGVQPDQVEQVKAFFAEKRIPVPELDPMVRGRVVSLNGRPVSEADYSEDRARRLIEREFNLSYRDSPPAHNQISAGRWFSLGSREISVEE
ncbi:MAG: ABC transporter permease, partial [Betaproteobacteria bacterium]|nr:ABC transporter permease [Betaproteobacteria bacterium]